MNQDISKIKIIIFGIISILTISCTEDFEIKLKTTERHLIVDGSINNVHKTHYIKLKYSTNYYDTIVKPVSNAIVTISDGESEVRFEEDSTLKGCYCSPQNYAGEIGKTYTLTIQNVDADEDGSPEIYTAESTIKPIGNLDSMSIGYTTNLGFGFWQLFIHFKEPAETEDFYVAQFYRNNILETSHLEDLNLFSDQYFDTNAYSNIDVFWCFDDESNEKITQFKLNDEFRVTLQNVEEDYYNYLSAAQSELAGSNPIFSGPPANVPTNISGNAYGYFLAYSQESVSVRIDENILKLRK